MLSCTTFRKCLNSRNMPGKEGWLRRWWETGDPIPPFALHPFLQGTCCILEDYLTHSQCSYEPNGLQRSAGQLHVPRWGWISPDRHNPGYFPDGDMRTPILGDCDASWLLHWSRPCRCQLPTQPVGWTWCLPDRSDHVRDVFWILCLSYLGGKSCEHLCTILTHQKTISNDVAALVVLYDWLCALILLGALEKNSSPSLLDQMLHRQSDGADDNHFHRVCASEPSLSGRGLEVRFNCY